MTTVRSRNRYRIAAGAVASLGLLGASPATAGGLLL